MFQFSLFVCVLLIATLRVKLELFWRTLNSVGDVLQFTHSMEDILFSVAVGTGFIDVQPTFVNLGLF